MCTGGMKISLAFDKEQARYEVAITGYLGEKQQFASHFTPAAARALAVEIVKTADLAAQRDIEATVAARGLIGQYRLQEGA